MFNLNRETKDTTAFNSWNRRNYITSDPSDPAVAIVIPPSHNEWRRNLILGRDFHGKSVCERRDPCSAWLLTC